MWFQLLGGGNIVKLFYRLGVGTLIFKYDLTNSVYDRKSGGQDNENFCETSQFFFQIALTSKGCLECWVEQPTEEST